MTPELKNKIRSAIAIGVDPKSVLGEAVINHIVRLFKEQNNSILEMITDLGAKLVERASIEEATEEDRLITFGGEMTCDHIISEIKLMINGEDSVDELIKEFYEDEEEN